MAGGAALVASDLIVWPTEDIDLFTAAPTTSVSAASEALRAGLGEQGYEVTVVQDASTFCRMVVSNTGDETLVDLAVDSPAAWSADGDRARASAGQSCSGAGGESRSE